MKDYKLTSFAKIKGLGAASGLLFDGDQTITLVSDDSDVLYHYNLKEKTLTKTNLRKDRQLLELRPKSEKSDFESITKFKNDIYIFGSGSSPKRNKLIILRDCLENNLQEISLSNFYDILKKSTNTADEDFNIEGAIVRENSVLLFNRGNGPSGKNGIFKVTNWMEESSQQIEFYPIPLPKIKDVPFGFTDAIEVGNKIYFLASAESGGSTYYDGDVLGSLIGILDTHTFELKQTQIITSEHKFEGIALYTKNEEKISFLLCEDSDDGGLETEVFLWKLPTT